MVILGADLQLEGITTQPVVRTGRARSAGRRDSAQSAEAGQSRRETGLRHQAPAGLRRRRSSSPRAAPRPSGGNRCQGRSRQKLPKNRPKVHVTTSARTLYWRACLALRDCRVESSSRSAVELFTIQCTTCRARLKVNDESVIGDILACPKCGSMVQVVPPVGWKRSAEGRALAEPLVSAPQIAPQIASSTPASPKAKAAAARAAGTAAPPCPAAAGTG